MKNFANTNSMTDLMIIALDNMEALIDDPVYNFGSDLWHEPMGNFCQVCLAGSIMANRLGANASYSMDPMKYSDDIRKKLCAIDALRSGHISLAWSYLTNMGYVPLSQMFVPHSSFDSLESAKLFIKFWRDEGLETLRGIEEEMT